MKSFPVRKQINMKSSMSLSISVLTTGFGIFKSSSRYSLRTHMFKNCKKMVLYEKLKWKHHVIISEEQT